MPKIRAKNLDEHHDIVWAALARGLEQLLSERPYEELSISDIAASAGIARNTMYNYARDKASLVAAAAASSSQKLLDEIIELTSTKMPPPLQISRMMRAILTWFSTSDHRRLVQCMLFGPVGASATAVASAPLMRINEPVSQVVRAGIDEGAFRQVGDVAFVVEMMAGVVQSAVLRVINDPDSLEQTVASVTAFVLHALGNGLAELSEVATPQLRRS